MTVPRHDFYQTDTDVIVSLYIKGYGAPEVKDKVDIAFEAVKVALSLPSLTEGGETQQIALEPLHAAINPDGSSARVLSSKIELKLNKAYPATWASVVSTGSPAMPAPASAGPSSQPAAPQAVQPKKKDRRNWDKVVDDELVEDKDADKDPNAGGDAALKDFFSKLYKDADEDTRRAMIKSYTESGGTTLSTNWADIGKETTPIRPPEGMEARPYQ